jgi:hypothetical protein
MNKSPLTLDSLESHLSYAERELEMATAERVRASETENQWLMEVQSVKNLISVYRTRANGNTNPVISPIPYTASGNGETAEVSHIDWMAALVGISDDRGISPPEILRAAERDGVKMHPNYPYTALRTLVEKKRVTKREGRYYAIKG